MAIVDGMSYRGITLRQAQWIGMAASVAGGFVAVDGPRLERQRAEQVERVREELYRAQTESTDEEYIEELERELHSYHRLQGGDYVRAEGYEYLILCVPAGAGLADEGFSLPTSLVREILPRLHAVGYAGTTLEG